MQQDALIKKCLAEFPFWDELAPSERAMALASALIRDFSKDHIISGSDLSCMGVVYVLEGMLRVSLISDEGREITLYRVYSGDRCVATASTLVSQITFERVVSAAADTRLLIIPSAVCSSLASRNIHVKEFIFETETRRYSQSIWVIQQMLFKRFDQRLASYLITRYEEHGKTDLNITQQEIARDINSAREVVARMLSHFSAEGLVEVKRGHVILRDIPGIKKLL